MNVKEYFFNRQCDVCGTLLDEECWHNDTDSLRDVAAGSGWQHLGGRDYCRDCWSIDDDDNIATKDGCRYDGDTHERISDGISIDETKYMPWARVKEEAFPTGRDGISIDELGEKTQQQVTAILAIDKMRTWFDALPPEEQASFAKEFPEFVTYEKVK